MRIDDRLFPSPVTRLYRRGMDGVVIVFTQYFQGEEL
jgi:hypothetical protein